MRCVHARVCGGARRTVQGVVDGRVVRWVAPLGEELERTGEDVHEHRLQQ